jgi:hypothetical protein
MRRAVEIEDIEALRLQEGIDDVELREDIRGLGRGDFVKLTVLLDGKPPAGETVLVRITHVRGRDFRGTLVRGPVAAGRSRLRAGSRVAFTADHIHSLPKGRPAHEL